MEWVNKPLGEVCRLINGRAYKKHEMLDSGPYPLLRVGNFFSNRSWYYSDLELVEDKYCDQGDLLYAWSASFGPRIWDGGKVIYHYHIWKILPDEDVICKEYLFYFLEWDKELIKAEQGTGSTMIHVTKASMEQRKLPLCNKSEQQKIVTILDKAFADIEQARANTEQNLQNARELFDSYLQQVFSECGEGWKKTTLNELCTKFEYGTSSKSSQEGEVPVIRMGNIQDGRIVVDKLVYSLNEEDNQKYHLNFNDVLFNRTNSAELVGKTAIYKSEERAIFAGYLIRIHRNEKLLNADYLNFYLNSPIARKYGEQVMSQSTNQANISGTKLKTYPISIPVSLEEQQSIVDKISTLKEKVEELEATHKSKLTALDELKQSLLQQAFTGQLTQG